MLTRANTSPDDIAALMADIGRRAKASSGPLAIASAERKHAALIAMADALRTREIEILAANAVDLDNGEKAGLSPAMIAMLREPQAEPRGLQGVLTGADETSATLLVDDGEANAVAGNRITERHVVEFKLAGGYGQADGFGAVMARCDRGDLANSGDDS